MKLTRLLLPVPIGEDIPWRLCKFRRLHTQSRNRRYWFPLRVVSHLPCVFKPEELQRIPYFRVPEPCLGSTTFGMLAARLSVDSDS